jgi:hypothetical protein
MGCDWFYVHQGSMQEPDLIWAGPVTDHPYRDSQGQMWINNTTFLATEPGHCFVCGNVTSWLNVCYEGYYCGSPECDRSIEEDLTQYE